MYRRALIVAFVAFILSGVQTLFAQSRIEKSQAQALANEVQKLVVFLDLDEKAQAELIEACADRMKEEISRVEVLHRESRRRQQNPFGEIRNVAQYHTENLSQEMLDFVRGVAKDRTAGDAGSAMINYLADAKGMRELASQVHQEVFVQTMDNALGLTEEQEREILLFIKSKWKKHWKTGATGLVEIADLERPSSFFENADRSLLTVEQAAFFDQYRLPLTMVEYNKILNPVQSGMEWNDSDFQEMCLKMLALKRTELAGTSLNEEQLQILAIGEKIAARKLTQIWKNAIDEFREKGNRDAAFQLSRSPILIQCTQQNEWKVAVRKAIGESVVETIKLDRRKKSDLRGRRTRLTALTSFMTSQTGVCLTFHQYRQLEELIKERIRLPNDEAISSHYFYSVYSLPEEDLQKILKPFQWNMAKDKIRRNRGIYETLMDRAREDQSQEPLR